MQRIRQRRNQRNSRARKQAYLENLEQRWSDCARTGAQATAEMQQAARRVDSQNGVLRDLLREVGVPDTVVEARLLVAGVARLRKDTTVSRPKVSSNTTVCIWSTKPSYDVDHKRLAMHEIGHFCMFDWTTQVGTC